MRVGVLGLGFMGSVHARALQSIAGAELTAVFSNDERRFSGLSAIEGNLGGPCEPLDLTKVAQYREIEALLADPAIDAVDICLPTHLHAPVAIEALRSGKHVLVEKPMALDAASARAMIAEAERNDRILMAAHVLRFFPMYEALAEALRTGELGKTRLAMFRRRCGAPAWSAWLTDPNCSGGGVFDLLIHDVDMCLRLFGRPESVSATGYEALDAGIDIITAELRYPGQGAAIVTGGWHHPKSYPFSMEYTVVTDGGAIDYSSLGRCPTLYRADGTAEALPMTDQDGYRAEIEYFLECCRKGQSPELCPPHESAAAVELTRLLLEARNRNGERIPWRA